MLPMRQGIGPNCIEGSFSSVGAVAVGNRCVWLIVISYLRVQALDDEIGERVP